MVLDEHWWAALDFIEPIMTMLRFADTDAPCLGDVYDGMDTMVEKVKLSIEAHETNPTECEALCQKVEAIIHHRWDKMTTPLHLLAYALSPRELEYILLYPFSEVQPVGLKEFEDLVYIHTNLRLLSRKDDGYNEGSTKFWDVAPECANLDATLQDLTVMTDDDVDNIIARASTTSGTMFGSNELASVAAEGDDENVDFFENSYDSD